MEDIHDIMAPESANANAEIFPILMGTKLPKHLVSDTAMDVSLCDIWTSFKGIFHQTHSHILLCTGSLHKNILFIFTLKFTIKEISNAPDFSG